MQTIYVQTTHFIRHTGNLVDLEEYRRKLTQVQAEEVQVQPERAIMEQLPHRAHRQRRWVRALAADWVASAAIVAAMITLIVKII